MRTAPALIAPALVAIALSASVPAHAQNPVGRYEMVTLPNKPGSFDNRVMILDTADGHLWQWWEAPAVGSLAPSSGITYLGKITPGNIPAKPYRPATAVRRNRCCRIIDACWNKDTARPSKKQSGDNGIY